MLAASLTKFLFDLVPRPSDIQAGGGKERQISGCVLRKEVCKVRRTAFRREYNPFCSTVDDRPLSDGGAKHGEKMTGKGGFTGGRQLEIWRRNTNCSHLGGRDSLLSGC